MKFWYQPIGILCTLLRPLSWCYRCAVSVRRKLYRLGWLKTVRINKPVVVIGNITVGGTGKTPIVIELTEQLKRLGYRPGVISRGYRGVAPHYPLIVLQDTNPLHCGDEPLLIAQKTHCPVVVDPIRVRAAQFLLEQFDIDLILSDDGLQHYALARDVEVAIRDTQLEEGNGLCLPAGPLRESVSRLDEMDIIIDNSDVKLESIYSLLSPERHYNIDSITTPVHSIAAIAHPMKFFSLLRRLGLTIIEHPFPDHHHFCERDILFDDQYPVLMTEKDAVKCREFAGEQHFVVAIKAVLPDELAQKIVNLCITI